MTRYHNYDGISYKKWIESISTENYYNNNAENIIIVIKINMHYYNFWSLKICKLVLYLRKTRAPLFSKIKQWNIKFLTKENPWLELSITFC